MQSVAQEKIKHWVCPVQSSRMHTAPPSSRLCAILTTIRFISSLPTYQWWINSHQPRCENSDRGGHHSTEGLFRLYRLRCSLWTTQRWHRHSDNLHYWLYCFCVENTVPTRKVQCFCNNKPWVAPDLTTLLNKKKVFKSGNKEELREVQRELKREIRRSKDCYRRSWRSSFSRRIPDRSGGDHKPSLDTAKAVEGAQNQETETRPTFLTDLSVFLPPLHLLHPSETRPNCTSTLCPTTPLSPSGRYPHLHPLSSSHNRGHSTPAACQLFYHNRPGEEERAKEDQDVESYWSWWHQQLFFCSLSLERVIESVFIVYFAHVMSVFALTVHMGPCRSDRGEPVASGAK